MVTTLHLHLVALLICLFWRPANCQSKVTQSDDGTSGTISFSTPDLNDEEAHSPWMPDLLKCDACKAVSFQLWTKFDAYNSPRKTRNYELRESEILDLTEDVCSNPDTFKDYGVKDVKKVKRLSGMGMETQDTPGVTAGGGKWPTRLRDMCEVFMGDLGEVKIYKVYKKNPKSRKRLEDYLCRGKGIRGECRDVTRVGAETKEEEEEKAKEEEKKAKTEL